ncbi:retrovirus-related Pol polyprotein from transposon opus [Trichonephila clavipes]|nr:retrovirus-related Pol polyprotein from transposon opus [Trichonephila clavipes]
MADLKDLKGALVFAMKFEAAQQATRKDRHPIRAVNESDTSNSSVERLERQMRSFMNRVESLMSQKADGKKTLKCWTCGREGHLQRSCRARQGAETNSASPEGGVGKLINGHLVGRRLPDFGKPHFQVCQISTKSTGENGIFIMGHVNELPCNMIIDTGANVSIIRNDLAQKLKEKLIWTPPRVVLQTVTGEKIDIHGKLKVKIQFGDTTYQHAVYVADIADPFILGLDFLKEHGFTLDFNKNELRSIHEEVTIFKIKHRTESIRQSSNVCLQKFELALSNSPQRLTPDLLENAELSLEQKSSAERLFQEFEDVFSRNSSDIGHTTVTQHRIDTADHPPIKQHPRRLPFAKQEEVGTLLQEMQENDIIEPSSSPWASQSSWFLKEALTSSPILIYPQPDKPFILDTDASNESVGAVLSQEIDGQERVVAYWSKCLSKPERNYCVTRKELLAIVKAIEHFHHYLYGQKFLLRTDHASLTWLMNFRNTEGQVARWIQRLNEYYFDIRHRKGSLEMLMPFQEDHAQKIVVIVPE